ncbi:MULTISPECIES: hypothetical protein [unclassified Vibrio]|uniref:hypothetical protein n=1 Tax=unclassified Vibrio TaxID=2614977 RepID=UPI0025544622|nr:hypothetical protein [Vibrio sp. D406a]MDK9775670.1 hypothetical protein [Vibrio sp. D401a]MDK9805544.1 hypothetical protein [Vibrio sp. D406a]
MKKLLLAAAVVAAAGGAGYLYQNEVANSSGSDALLSQVPADTLLITYQTKPINYYEYMNAFGTAQQPQMSELFAEEELTPGLEFAVNFLDAYVAASSSPESLKAFMGTGDSVSPVIYTLGFIPVYKVQLENPAALWKTLDEQEQLSGFQHELVKLDKVEYRRYELTESQDKLMGIGLVVAVVDNVLTVTFDIPELGVESPLKLAFGLESPKNSIVDSGRLEALQNKYGASNNSFGIVDIREIIKGLTTVDGNRMARQLKIIQSDPVLDQLRSPACHTEFTQIAENWPQMVAFAEYSAGDDKARINGGFVVESKNQVILEALQSVRGVLAESNGEQSMFSLALGLDVATLAPAIGKIWTDLTTPEYQCSILAQAQNDMRGQNPAPAISMGAGMANGLKGLSMEMFGLDVNMNGQYGPELGQLDAIFSISADDPNMLLQTAQMFMPELAQIQIQPDNQPVNIGGLLEPYAGKPMDVFARLNGSHLTLYSGEAAAAASEKVMAQPLTANGLLSFTMDSDRVLEVIETASEVSGEPVPEDVKMSLQGELIGGMALDVTKDGIVFDFDYTSSTKPQVKVAQQ